MSLDAHAVRCASALFLVGSLFAQLATAQRVAPGPVVVRVVSAEDQQPLAGVRVQVGTRYAATTIDGVATLDGMPAGAVALIIEQVGFERWAAQLELPAGQRDALSVQLVPLQRARLSGRVLLEDTGRPVPCSRVRLEPVEVAAAVQGPFEFTTDWDGTFAVLELPPGKYRALVRMEGCLDASFDVAVEGDTEGIELVLARDARPAALTVEVTDAHTGQPIEGARLDLAEAYSAGALAQATTDSNGRATFQQLLVGGPNRAGDSGVLGVVRRRVTLHAGAVGYADNLTSVGLHEAAEVRIALASVEPVPESEDNDGFATAELLLPGRPVELTITPIGDQDTFRFRLPQPALLDISLGPKVPFENLIELFGREGQLMASQVGYSTKENRLVRGVPAGEYVVGVRQRYNKQASPETLRLLVQATIASDALEPNDQPGEARLVRAGESIRGTILPVADRDYFRFELKRLGTVRITRLPHPLESVLELTDASGKVRQGAVAYANKPAELIAPLEAGWHTFVHRQRYDNTESTEPYVLKLDIGEDDLFDDPAEGQGRLRALHALPLSGIQGATLNPAFDVDRYALATPSAGRLRIRLVSPVESVVQVREASGKILASGIAYAQKPGLLDWSAQGPQIGYLEVRGRYKQNWSLNPYTLETFFEPADEAERMGANDTAEQATSFEPGDVLRGGVNPVGDVDWYRIALNHPAHLTIEGVSPVETVVTIHDAALARLSDSIFYATHPAKVEADLLAGTSLVSVRQRYGNQCAPADYQLRTVMDFADGQETQPLKDDRLRRLALGEARSFRIDHLRDRDRFVIDVPQAGAYGIRVHAPLECVVKLFDDRSNREVHTWIAYTLNPLQVRVEAGGPTRYRIEITQRYGNQRSSVAGFVEVGPAERPIAAARIRLDVDPTDPTQVVLTPEPIERLAAVTRIRVDTDGDGKPDAELPVAGGRIRYAREGIYPANFLFEGPDGARTRLEQRIPALGPRERKGVFLAVDFPAEGQVVADARPAVARAISYEGTPIALVSAVVEGRVVASRHAPPFRLEVPWESFGPGEHRIAFLARDRRGHEARLERTFTLSEYFGLTPEDGAALTGDDIFVRWQGTTHGPALVRYRKSGEQEWRETTGEEGRRRRVRLGDLEPHVAYEIQPVGAGEPGPTRTITRVKGLAFGRSRYAATIARDYDQRVAISVRNHAEEAIALSLRAGTPPASLLLVGFVGEGSKGEPLVLEPGEEREFWLGLSAQDVLQEEHLFPILISSESGYSDEAEVAVRVRLPRVELEWEDLGPSERGLGRRLRLTNRGDPITDLRIESTPAGVALSPGVEHGLLPAGRSLLIDALPVLYAGFQQVETVVVARAIGTSVEQPIQISLEDGQSVFAVPLSVSGGDDPLEQRLHAARLLAGHYLNPEAVDWSAHSIPEDSDGDGRIDRFHQDDEAANIRWTGADTDGDGEIDFVQADLGRDGQYDSSAFRTEQGWERTNLVETWLELNFSLPWSRAAYEAHDVDVLFNGSVVGSIRERIPEGNYTFRIPPRLVTFDDAGAPSGNHIEIRSEHLRGGHYIVSSDFRIKSRLIGTRAWTVAESAEQARELALSQKGLLVTGPDFAVSSSEVTLTGVDAGTEIPAGTEIFVNARVRNLGASRTRGVEVALFRSDPGRQGVELTRTLIEDVPLSAAVDVALPWTASAGRHVLSVVVDPDQRSGDTQRSNNAAQLSLSIAGDDAPPTVAIEAPEEGLESDQSTVPLTVVARDDSAIARVEARVDGGAWCDLERGGDRYRGLAQLQPGAHAITVRATDSSGHRVESVRRVSVKVEGHGPDGQAGPDGPDGGLEAPNTIVSIRDRRAGGEVDLPQALRTGPLIYRCTHSELYLTVEMDGRRLVASSATPAGEGRRAFSGSIASGGSGASGGTVDVKAGYAGDESQGEVHGIFYPDGREAELVWQPDGGELQWTRWIRVAAVGSNQPLPPLQATGDDPDGGQ